ncbi:MAG TPA: hypothetical protein VG498_11670 [Terriglobales bacterium]|nr:hypothetical protein [Terriglobales bacterium]
MSLVNLLFGCWHKNVSFPFTTRSQRRSAAAQVTGTYVVCLDCGKEFPYDWKEMKLVNRREHSPKVTSIREPAQSLAKTA